MVRTCSLDLGPARWDFSKSYRYRPKCRSGVTAFENPLYAEKLGGSMNLYSKLSALAAVLVLSTPFASADTVTLLSNSTTVKFAGYDPVIHDVNNPQPGLNAPTFNIGTGGVWTAPVGGSSWVSFDPNSGPGGGSVDPNGTYTYFTSFTMAAGDI